MYILPGNSLVFRASSVSFSVRPFGEPLFLGVFGQFSGRLLFSRFSGDFCDFQEVQNEANPRSTRKKQPS